MSRRPLEAVMWRWSEQIKKGLESKDRRSTCRLCRRYILEELVPRKNTLEEREPVEIAEGKVTRVAGELGVKKNLIACLKRNEDIFAKDIHDLMGIDLKIAEHHLNVNRGAQPVKQKKCHFGPKKDKVIAKEVEKLLLVRHVKEIQFLE